MPNSRCTGAVSWKRARGRRGTASVEGLSIKPRDMPVTLADGHGTVIFSPKAVVTDGIEATVNGAKAMRMEREIGMIEKGRYADLVLLDRDPLASVENLSHAAMVMKGGKVFKPEELIRSLK